MSKLLLSLYVERNSPGTVVVVEDGKPQKEVGRRKAAQMLLEHLTDGCVAFTQKVDEVLHTHVMGIHIMERSEEEEGADEQ